MTVCGCTSTVQWQYQFNSYNFTMEYTVQNHCDYPTHEYTHTQLLRHTIFLCMCFVLYDRDGCICAPIMYSNAWSRPCMNDSSYYIHCENFYTIRGYERVKVSCMDGKRMYAAVYRFFMNHMWIKRYFICVLF